MLKISPPLINKKTVFFFLISLCGVVGLLSLRIEMLFNLTFCYFKQNIQNTKKNVMMSIAALWPQLNPI